MAVHCSIHYRRWQGGSKHFQHAALVSRAASPDRPETLCGRGRTQPKWVTMTGKASAKADTTASGEDGRAVGDYLLLPVSQYSLLDPQWVVRRVPMRHAASPPLLLHLRTPRLCAGSGAGTGPGTREGLPEASATQCPLRSPGNAGS